MRRIVLFYLFCGLSFSILAQNMEGTWEGFLDQSLDASKKAGYQMYWAEGLWKHGNPTHFLKLTLRKESDGQYSGFYHVALQTNTSDYARFTAIASYKDSILTYKTLDKIIEHSKYIYCFNQSSLRYRFDNDFEYLEGECRCDYYTQASSCSENKSYSYD